MTTIEEQAQPIVSEMLDQDEDALYRELAARRQVIEDFPEVKDQLDPEFEYVVPMGITDDVKAFMKKFVDGVNRDCHAIVCTQDDAFSDLRNLFKDTPDKFAAGLVGVLIASNLVPAALATVVASIIARVLLKNAHGALCEVWSERLPEAEEPE